MENWKFAKLLHDLALPVCNHPFSRTRAPESSRHTSDRSHLAALRMAPL